MNIYTKLVKQTIETYLKNRSLPRIEELPKEFINNRAACFVSIYSKNKELRGCMGTVAPVYKNLGGEIIANTLEAAFHDPRFKPITQNELDDLTFSVDVLGGIEEIDSEDKLDPKKYGIVVKSLDLRTGLLLPNLENINTVKQQIKIAREKAGILPDDKIILYRFSTHRFK